ncbi:MAG: Smr/MutS family protein [Ghiorsea sp.]
MNDDDLDLFAQEMGKVEPLTAPKPRINSQKPKNKHEILQNIVENTPPTPLPQQHALPISAARVEQWQLCASGISNKDLKKLAQANLQDDELDLHGLSQQQAVSALADFMQQALQQHIRQVRIVHGRGLHSSTKPILKNITYQWLEQGEYAAYILAAIPTPQSKGGASHVLLRRVNK